MLFYLSLLFLIVYAREDIYQINLNKINIHNQGNYPWKLGVNQFTDMSEEQFLSLLGRNNVMEDLKLSSDVYQKQRNLVTDGNFDWKRYTTPVKNQGMCGSCWAFAGAETIESHLMIYRDQFVELSEQQLVECDVNNQGCEGGSDIMSYIYAMNTPLSIEWSYPYTSFFGEESYCNKSKVREGIKIKAYERVRENNYDDLMDALYHRGPLSVAVDASTWSSYQSGIFDGCNKTDIDLNHAVQLVGYGTDQGLDYWLVRNSWGIGWGRSRLYTFIT
jgi:C1A family cysteine protease